MRGFSFCWIWPARSGPRSEASRPTAKGSGQRLRRACPLTWVVGVDQTGGGRKLRALDKSFHNGPRSSNIFCRFSNMPNGNRIMLLFLRGSMKRIVICGFLGLSACASTESLPVVGKLSNGSAAQGNVTVDLSPGAGTFEMFTLGGLSCNGTSGGFVTSPTIRVPVTCNNGQSGVVIATRDTSVVAGTAEARLRNGMSGRFLFGNISAQQQAEYLRLRRIMRAGCGAGGLNVHGQAAEWAAQEQHHPNRAQTPRPRFVETPHRHSSPGRGRRGDR